MFTIGLTDHLEGPPDWPSSAIFDEVADLVVHEGGADGGLQAKAFAEAARGVVLAAAFPSGEGTRRADAALAGIEAEHDLSEGDLVINTGVGGLDIEAHGMKESGKL